MRRWILLALCVIASPALAQTRGANTPVFGTGRLSCEQAISAEQVGRAEEWLFGYLTAFGESFGPRFWLGDAQTVSDIFRRSCAANPKANLVEAARSVILTLQARRPEQKK